VQIVFARTTCVSSLQAGHKCIWREANFTSIIRFRLRMSITHPFLLDIDSVYMYHVPFQIRELADCFRMHNMHIRASSWAQVYLAGSKFHLNNLFSVAFGHTTPIPFGYRPSMNISCTIPDMRVCILFSHAQHAY
jgi:hypothetical protein